MAALHGRRKIKRSSWRLNNNTYVKDSMLVKHGSRLVHITPWNYNGESPWNIPELSVVNPLFVTHGSRLTHQRSSFSVRCSCSRCSSASPSVGLCNVYALQKCVRTLLSQTCTQKLIVYQSLTKMCTMCTHLTAVFNLVQQFLWYCLLFSKTNFNLKTPCTHCTHLYNPHFCSLLTLLKCVHMCVHSAYTWGSNAYTSGK